MIGLEKIKNLFNQPEMLYKCIIQLTAVFWMLEKIIGWRLWTNRRTFPLVPIFEALNQLPTLFHDLLFAINLLAIFAVFVVPEKKKLLAGLFFIELFSCLFDQNRWQPWEYQFLFILFASIYYEKKNLLPICLFIMGCIYSYSGLHKLNPHFLQLIWDNMILKQFLHVPAQIIANKWIHHAGYALGCIELLFGLLFLFNKKRKLAIIILILTHICILLLIGPLGLKYNIIVWPWNVYMILMLMLCFLTEKEQLANANHIKISGIKFVFICWAILPAFSIWGYWDHYLSSNLYGGNTPKASICLDDTTQLTKLKNFIYRTNASCKCTSSWQINFQQWSMREMNVPVYPEERIYKAIFKQWEQQYPHTHCKLIIYE